MDLEKGLAGGTNGLGMSSDHDLFCFRFSRLVSALVSQCSVSRLRLGRTPRWEKSDLFHTQNQQIIPQAEFKRCALRARLPVHVT